MRTRPTIKIYAGKFDFIPIVDLFFLLLIFFLISSSLVFQPGIAVELPQVHTMSKNAAEKIIITITNNNHIFLNDQPVDSEELPSKLRKTVDSKLTFISKSLKIDENDVTITRSPKVVIRADKNVSYQTIMKTMSLARSLGLGVYLVTDSEPIDMSSLQQ